MSEMKSLAKDTAIYGLSSIIGKFLNYLLVPLYTYVLARTDDYGIVTNLYAWTALLLVILTYGMETGFFRFANREDYDPKSVYKTAYITLLISSAMFTMLVFIFHQPIANILGYPDHSEFVEMMFATVAVDAFASIPFAYLRNQKRPILFAALKLLFVLLNIGFNILFLVVLGMNDVFYVFLSNLLATAIQTLCLLPFTMPKGGKFDSLALKEMLRYSLPLLVLGVAGIMNQTLDRILFPYLYTGEDAQAQLGIYGACFKVAMVMMMFTQAFRYAYEPIVFADSKDRNSPATLADGTLYFIVFTLLAFLGVMVFMPVLQHFVGAGYRVGLGVIPVVMMAEIFMGVYFNLSFWYKLTDQNWWGAIISAIAVAVMVAINIIFVPKIGYWACAWGGFAGYGIAMLLSYFIGQRKYPIHYDLRGIGLAVLVAAGAYAAHAAIVRAGAGPVLSIILGCLLILCYSAVMFLYLRRVRQ